MFAIIFFIKCFTDLSIYNAVLNPEFFFSGISKCTMCTSEILFYSFDDKNWQCAQAWELRN